MKVLAAIACASVLAATWGCDVVTDQAVEAADFAGAKADAHCDRRFVTDGGEPSAFCQELVATVAASEFADDCRAKHQATADQGLCPRAAIIAGCKIHKQTDDNSLVYDWYYDVSALAAEGGVSFESRPRNVTDVARMCADPTRYEEGAELVMP